MNRFIIISLLLVMLLQIFSKVLIVVDYQANKNSIIELFCINKSKPQLHCDGKCYLTKKLKKAEQQENNTSENSQKYKFEVSLFYQDLFKLQSINFDSSVILLSLYQIKLPKSKLTAVFHPPHFTV